MTTIDDKLLKEIGARRLSEAEFSIVRARTPIEPDPRTSSRPRKTVPQNCAVDAKTCRRCRRTFETNHFRRVLCTDCIRVVRANERDVCNAQAHLDSSAIGACGELRVAIVLLQAGFYVFRPVTGTCPCDLLAMRDRYVWRIEVKSFASPLKTFAAKQIHDCVEVVAKVSPEGVDFLERVGPQLWRPWRVWEAA